jgi:hypothetical protein
VFEKAFEGSYIKMNNIEQRNAGDVYAIAYQDSGEFSVCVINNEGTVLDEIDLTAIFDLNVESKPVTGFWEPLITSNFITDHDLYIAVYHRIN